MKPGPAPRRHRSLHGLAEDGFCSVRIVGWRSPDRVKRRGGLRRELALKMTGAVAAVMPDARALRLLVLKGDLALRAGALRLRVAGPAYQPDVTHRAIDTKMAGDGKIVHSTDGG